MEISYLGLDEADERVRFANFCRNTIKLKLEVMEADESNSPEVMTLTKYSGGGAGQSPYF